VTQRITMTNSKTIISYNGGCAGDLFVKSCNGETLTELSKLRVVQPATLKNYEQQIRLGVPADLDKELNSLPYTFVNTHLLDEVVDKGVDVYNIVMSNKDTQLKTIYRQMQIQKLQIKIDTDSWYMTIHNHCVNQNYTKAAMHWYEKAEQLWLDRMEYRLNYTKAKVLDFNQLYNDGFIDDLAQQGWTHNTALLKYNHNRWLEENNDFTYDKTIGVMANKLSTMNWSQQEGWVVYNPT